MRDVRKQKRFPAINMISIKDTESKTDKLNPHQNMKIHTSPSARPFLQLLALLCITCSAGAVDLMNTLPGVSDQTAISAGSRAAQEFLTTSSGYIITNVEVLGYRLYNDQNISIKIYTADNNAPGYSIATLFSGTASSFGFWDSFSIRTPASISGLSVGLAPQTLYWLVVENQSTSNIWLGIAGSNNYLTKQSAGLTGNDWVTNPGDYTQKVGAVPEPASILLFIIGLGFCFAIASRMRLNANK